MQDYQTLIGKAAEAAKYSYSPYSRFRVGAALLCKNGDIVSGANIENRSFGLTNCAERSALFTALSAGYTEFSALAVYSPDSAAPIPPCGACRQVLSEFAAGDFPVVFSGTSGAVEVVKMSDLLPFDSLHDLAEG